MIFTNRKNAKRYENAAPLFKEAFEALFKLADGEFVPGRHEVRGDEIFIFANEYRTKPADQTLYEAHRKYVDVMLMLEGEEYIAHTDIEGAGEITDPYDEKKGDYILAKEGVEPSISIMRPGDIAIFFPEDLHCPGRITVEVSNVRKLVAKVLVK